MTARPARVTVVEVGPRDGLQNEPAEIPTAEKVAFVDALSHAGLPVIEVSAFVSPKWVPRMADAAEVYASIHRRPGARYPALVPNLAGLERARSAGVREIAIFAAASNTFSRRNINQSIDESLATYVRFLKEDMLGSLQKTLDIIGDLEPAGSGTTLAEIAPRLDARIG